MRVVCIKELKHKASMGEITPEVGKVYTVRETLTFLNGQTGYRLVEIKNKIMKYLAPEGVINVECCFSSDAFRPATDISSLVRLTKVRELEDA